MSVQGKDPQQSVKSWTVSDVDGPKASVAKDDTTTLRTRPMGDVPTIAEVTKIVDICRGAKTKAEAAKALQSEPSLQSFFGTRYLGQDKWKEAEVSGSPISRLFITRIDGFSSLYLDAALGNDWDQFEMNMHLPTTGSTASTTSIPTRSSGQKNSPDPTTRVTPGCTCCGGQPMVCPGHDVHKSIGMPDIVPHGFFNSQRGRGRGRGRVG